MASLVLGAMPLAAFGSEADKATWLPRVARGEVVLTAALQELTPREKRDPDPDLAVDRHCRSIADVQQSTVSKPKWSQAWAPLPEPG